MAESYLQEAQNLFPGAVSNYEALDRLASSIHKELLKMQTDQVDEFVKLRNKYFAVINERNSSPVILSQPA
jgi:hypothetical protein